MPYRARAQMERRLWLCFSARNRKKQRGRSRVPLRAAMFSRGGWPVADDPVLVVWRQLGTSSRVRVHLSGTVAWQRLLRLQAGLLPWLYPGRRSHAVSKMRAPYGACPKNVPTGDRQAPVLTRGPLDMGPPPFKPVCVNCAQPMAEIESLGLILEGGRAWAAGLNDTRRPQALACPRACD